MIYCANYDQYLSENAVVVIPDLHFNVDIVLQICEFLDF